MKRRCNKRPEPRTELIGLNLTDADLAQLDELFTLLKADFSTTTQASASHTKHSCVPMFRNRPRLRARRQTFPSAKHLCALRLGQQAQT
jgi:hypothetical protein